MTLTDAVVAAFWRRVQVVTDGCWGWTGYKNPGKNRYGQITFHLNGRSACVTAHRASWLIHYGPIPSRAVIMHACNNPSCANPEHLMIGDARQNAADAVRDGLIKSGEANHASKLSWVQVAEIRRRASERTTALAREFGISRTQIRNIIADQQWKRDRFVPAQNVLDSAPEMKTPGEIEAPSV